MSHSPRRGLLALSTLVLGALLAQAPCLCAQDVAPPGTPPRDVRYFDVRQKQSTLNIPEKGARVVRLEKRIKTVDGFDPAVIRVTQVNNDPHQIRVQAITSGVTSMVLVDEVGDSFSLEVLVGADTRHFEALVKEVFPDSSVKVVKLKESALIHGWVTQSDQVQVIIDMAKEFYPEPLNYLRVSGDQQVMLHVKIMEVQRGKIRKLGFNFLAETSNASGSSHIGGLTNLAAGPIPLSAGFDQAAVTGSIGIVNNDLIFQGFLEALKEESLLKVLAEPNLVAINGRPANFLNGGEFPILVPQGFGTVSVQFRPFGVRLEFVANNTGNGRVRLDVTPEVSDRDFTNSVNVNGIVVPALTVRRANTQVEMNVGETLIIAGLISNRVQARAVKTPFLGELPWIGAAFRRVSYDEAETELLIMVTPELAGPITDGCLPPGPGTNTTTPTDRELFGSGYLENRKYAPDPDEGMNQPGLGGQGLIGPDLGPHGAPHQAPGLPPAVPPEHFLSSPPAPPPPAASQTTAPLVEKPTTRKAAPKSRQSAGQSKGKPALTSPERKRLPSGSSQMIQPTAGTRPPPQNAGSSLITP